MQLEFSSCIFTLETNNHICNNLRDQSCCEAPLNSKISELKYC